MDVSYSLICVNDTVCVCVQPSLDLLTNFWFMFNTYKSTAFL